MPSHRYYKQKSLWEIGASVLLFGLTALTSSILLLQANGYWIDFQELSVQKMGLLVLRYAPSDAVVIVADTESRSFRGEYAEVLPPGVYDVTITKLGYHAWQRTAAIHPGAATSFLNRELFLQSPVLLATTSPDPTDVTTPVIGAGLLVRENELWIHREDAALQLVTRLSRPIRSAVRTSDQTLAYQVENEIHVIDEDGRNDRVLFQLPDDRERRIRSLDGGRRIRLIEADVVEEYQIQ
ncbi:hypothetical protein HY375_02175 [Candidatus Berkelbacteria bacterium]|nr:hypothetical protein [Candidatus Berkelbacteria bacterium]